MITDIHVHDILYKIPHEKKKTMMTWSSQKILLYYFCNFRDLNFVILEFVHRLPKSPQTEQYKYPEMSIFLDLHAV